MCATLTKKSIIKKTVTVGSSTLLSRVFGLIRETLMARYLGVGAMSDAFFTAYKIPNSLRKIFAEGALSAAFIPAIVGLVKKDKRQEANSLMTLAFLVFEGVLLLLCLIIFFNTDFIVHVTTPGFSQEQINHTIPFLRILIFFILFLSSSALLTGALQSVHHFFVPAFGPVLLNVVFISALLLSLWYGLPVKFLCYAILLGGLLQFILHIFTYFKLGFSFGKIDAQAVRNFKQLLKKFFPVLFSMSIMEISLFLDISLASYLPEGSVSLINYGSRFMGIPLGVFATAFSTILLPHFSRISTYAPKRLSFYLFESTKIIFWVTIPATILMSFFADKIFVTLFLSKNFSMAKVIEAQYILIAFLTGLFFFSLNKILLNIYYSLHNTVTPTIISVIATTSNFILNIILMKFWGATGIALATAISGAIQTFLFVYLLHRKYAFQLYPAHFLNFLYKFLIQLIITLIGFFVLYNYLTYSIAKLPEGLANFLLNKIGFWLWVGPLCIIFFLVLYKLKKFFGVRLYFLD